MEGGQALNGAGWCNMTRRQAKPQEFLTGFQVDGKTLKKDVSSKLEKAGVPKLTAVIFELDPPAAGRLFLMQMKLIEASWRAKLFRKYCWRMQRRRV